MSRLRKPADRFPRSGSELPFSPRSRDLDRPRFPYLAAAMLVVCIAITGLLYIRSERRRVREQAEAQLTAISDLKVSQIVSWRKERLADAAVIQDADLFQLLKQRAEEPSSTTIPTRLRTWLGSIARNYGYTDVVIVNPRGEAVAAAGNGEIPSPSHVLRHVSEAVRHGGAVITELERDERTGQVHLDVVAPLFDSSNSGRLLGALLLRLDPRDFLYPLIQSWPSPSPSAETLLVRIDGDSIVFLNELRHRHGTALSLRLKLDDRRHPSVQTALGKQGVTSGVDYRGVDVLGTGRAIAGSSWFLVAKVDASEVLAPARTQALTLGIVVLLLMSGGVGTLALWWRRETSRAERREIEVLRESDEMLRHLHDAVVGLDANHIVTAWNTAAERMFGVDASEAIGRRLDAVVSSDYRGYSSQAAFLETLQERGQLEFEVRRHLMSGAWVDVEASGVVLRDGEGRVTGYVSVNRDVTVRKLTETALRESQQRLARILETFNDPIWIVDAEGRLEYMNARAAEFYGTAPEAMLGRPILEFVPEEVRDIAAADNRSVANGESIRREFLTRRPNGVEIWFQLSRSALRDAEGRPVGSVAVFVDVTEQRRAREQLLEAQKLEAVGRLASGIAHEINTPIQYIGDNARFLEEAFASLCRMLLLQKNALSDSAIPAEVRSNLDHAAEGLDLDYLVEQGPKSIARTLEGLQRVATIVRAMKEFAHPDSKEMVPTDLNRALAGTLEVARNEYKYVADVQAEYGDLPPVQCHLGVLNQAFLNMIVNAAHAIGDVVKGTSQRGTIRVQTQREGTDVVISIADTGGGIPEAIRAKIFDPFFTTKEVGRGTGQGLPIARNAVLDHGGTLTFTSKEGEGTTFFIRIPIERALTREPRAA